LAEAGFEAARAGVKAVGEGMGAGIVQQEFPKINIIRPGIVTDFEGSRLLLLIRRFLSLSNLYSNMDL
jgi:hypothetical protein